MTAPYLLDVMVLRPCDRKVIVVVEHRPAFDSAVWCLVDQRLGSRPEHSSHGRML